mgnify:FL=1
MAQLVHNYIDSLEGLKEEVVNNADNILGVIDLNELLKDPEGYLLSLGDAFLDEHLDEIEKAKAAGVRFADKILKES